MSKEMEGKKEVGSTPMGDLPQAAPYTESSGTIRATTREKIAGVFLLTLWLEREGREQEPKGLEEMLTHWPT